MTSPRADRPHLPASYGSAKGDFIRWEDVSLRLSNARNYWVVTVSPSGTPHARPLWGVWIDDRFYLEGNPTVTWARNVQYNAHAEIHLDNSDNVVTVNGTFTEVPDVGASLYARIIAEYDRKYDGYRPPDPEDRGYYVFTLKRAFAWTHFPDDATRFTWSDPPQQE
jgi:hypothetical protein